MLVEQVGRNDGESIQQVADALVRVVGGAPHDPNNLVAFVDQELGEVRAVLASDTCDESSRHRCFRVG